MIVCGMCGIEYVQMIDEFVISYYPECKCAEIADDLLLLQTELGDAEKRIEILREDNEELKREIIIGINLHAEELERSINLRNKIEEGDQYRESLSLNLDEAMKKTEELKQVKGDKRLVVKELAYYYNLNFKNEKKIETLTKALELYADDNNWYKKYGHPDNWAIDGSGDVARKALAEL